MEAIRGTRELEINTGYRRLILSTSGLAIVFRIDTYLTRKSNDRESTAWIVLDSTDTTKIIDFIQEWEG